MNKGKMFFSGNSINKLKHRTRSGQTRVYPNRQGPELSQRTVYRVQFLVINPRVIYVKLVHRQLQRPHLANLKGEDCPSPQHTGACSYCRMWKSLCPLILLTYLCSQSLTTSFLGHCISNLAPCSTSSSSANVYSLGRKEKPQRHCTLIHVSSRTHAKITFQPQDPSFGFRLPHQGGSPHTDTAVDQPFASVPHLGENWNQEASSFPHFQTLAYTITINGLKWNPSLLACFMNPLLQLTSQFPFWSG